MSTCATTQAEVPVPANLAAVRLRQPVGRVHTGLLALALVLAGALAASLPGGPGAVLAASLTRAADAGPGAVGPAGLGVFLGSEHGRLLRLPGEVVGHRDNSLVEGLALAHRESEAP